MRLQSQHRENIHHSVQYSMRGLKNLKDDVYNGLVAKLISFNYINVEFNADMIIAAAKESEGLPSYTYNKIIDIMAHENK